VTTQSPQIRIDIHAGMGCVLDADEAYALESEEGAIVLIVESDRLLPHARGISTPERVAGQTWPSDAPIQLNAG
jgi:hypothetical protein